MIRVKLLFPMILVLNPVTIKVVRVFIFGVVMFFPFDLKLIRIFNVVVTVLI